MKQEKQAFKAEMVSSTKNYKPLNYMRPCLPEHGSVLLYTFAQTKSTNSMF